MLYVFELLELTFMNSPMMPWDRPATPPKQPLSLLGALEAQQEVSWACNPDHVSDARDATVIASVEEAAARLDRFAPWIAETFPDTAQPPRPGRIESALEPIPDTQSYVAELMDLPLPGELWVKRDDSLPISGSIKARGGIHEVLRLAEEYPDPTARAELTLSVASTGNLGLSVGTIGPRLGFPTVVHMSTEAKQWKKDSLRAGGATVIEHPGLFTETVAAARDAAADDPATFFIDDENSPGLFAGYAVAGQRLKAQFDALGRTFTPEAPLHVYLPCGVGGGPGGVAFGLKLAFGDNVHCHFVEPVASPCFMLGAATGKGAAVNCADYGLSGRTVADGLAVQSPSPFAFEHASHLISGFHTVDDVTILASVNWLERTAGMSVEPSAASGLTIPWRLPAGDIPENTTHLVWLTGGALIPDRDRDRLRGQAATAALQWSAR